MNITDKDKKFLFNFITSYSVLLIIILVMGLFLYSVGMSDAKENIIKQNETLLKSSVADLDSVFILLSNISVQYTSNYAIRKLTAMTDTNLEFYVTAKECMNILSNNMFIINTIPVKDYYIFMQNTNYMLYSGHLSNSRLAYSQNGISSDEKYLLWLETMNSKYNNKSLINLNNITVEQNDNYLYKIPLSDYYLNTKYDAFACFELDKSLLMDYFSNISIYDKGFLYVCNPSGTMQFTISNSKNTLTNDILPYVSYILDKLNNNVLDYNTANTFKHNGMFITTAVSNYNGFIYILAQPKSLIFKSLVSYQHTYSIIILSACIFCIILIFILAKRNIKPIVQINNQLATSMIRENALKEILEKQRPLINSTLVSRLMHGLVYTKEDVSEIVSVLSLNEVNVKYAVLYITLAGRHACDNIYNISGHTESDIEIDVIELTSYKPTLKNMLYSYFGSDIYMFEPDIESFAVLLSSDDDISYEEFVSDISNTFTDFHIAVMDEFSIWSTAGLGSRNNDISFIWKSYQQAYEALSYINNQNIFCTFADIRHNTTFYYYPFEMAQQLSNFIAAGNSKQVSETFRLIRKENIENRSLSASVIKWLLSDIRNTLLKVRYSINSSDTAASVLHSADLLLTEEKNLDTLEEAALKLCFLFTEKNDSSGNKLIASIQIYIDKNFKDPSLSLKKISDEFNISESYFSSLFKSEVGHNFSEYLEQLRMEYAMKLIKDKNISISDLYLEVGYNNANSFRRAFKKINGVSPKTVRDSLKLNE